MNKVVTLRLSDKEYSSILHASKMDRRPISNFITMAALKQIEESFYVDPIEMAEIRSSKKLLKRLKSGHEDAKTFKGRLVG